ncbi:O-antigen ligase family protein [Domibacillus indicus]|uniref:O-antigen ligase family protein n=1 Tax=Domibacillus indicus TaxID=1437523 RepID=UPI000617C4D3|nr:O-antigen ligase family protein [Domibacillus indicus]
MNVPFFLLLITIFSIPWENALMLGPFGTIVRPLGLLAFMMTVLAIMRNGQYRPLNLIHYVLLAFILWSGFSIIWSADPDLTLTRIKTYAQLFIMVWLIWELARTQTQMNMIMQAYVWGAWVSVVDTISNYVSEEQVAYGRYAAEGFDPNDLGVMLALGIPMAWYLFLNQKHALLRWMNAAYLLFGMWTISLTASRTAFVVGLVALLYILLTFKKLSRGMKAAMAVILAASSIYVYQKMPEDSLERIATIHSDVSQGDLNGRGSFWEAGMNIVNSHPIIGVGAGAYPEAMESLIQERNLSHNTPLSILAETGLIGMLLFLVVLFLFLRVATKTGNLESMMFLTLLVVWFMATMFLTWEMRKPTWLLFGLLALEYARTAKPALPAREHPL